MFKKIGNIIDTCSNIFASKEELEAKQDTLVSGTNIKTINNQSILGTGNVQINNTGLQSGDNISELVNDIGYLTEHQSLTNYYTKTEVEDLINTTVHSILQSIFDNKIGDLRYSNGRIIAQLYESDDL